MDSQSIAQRATITSLPSLPSRPTTMFDGVNMSAVTYFKFVTVTKPSKDSRVFTAAPAATAMAANVWPTHPRIIMTQYVAKPFAIKFIYRVR